MGKEKFGRDDQDTVISSETMSEKRIRGISIQTSYVESSREIYSTLVEEVNARIRKVIELDVDYKRSL